MAMSQAVTMKKLREIVLPIFVILCADVTNGELGAVCNKVTDCSMGGYCMQGTCNCSEIWYAGNSLTPVCRSWEYERLCSRDDECGEDAKCKNVKCECNKGFYRINASCHKVTLQRLLQPCKINLYRTGTALCDIRKHSTCIRNTCVCTKGYVANEHGQCELKDSYLVRMEMSEYRVKPGEYCRDSTNCIEGLVCEGFKCKCPTACTYDQRKEFCDCGDVEEQVGPIIIGVLLGLNIIFFWGYTIKRTIRKHKEMMKQFSSLPADDEYVPRSYALSHVHSSIQTETTVGGTASPASRIAGTSITEDTGTTATYSLHPPTLPNDPLNPESDKPPSYIDVISSSLHNPDPSSQPLAFVPNAPYPHAYIPLSCSTQQSSSPPHSLSGRPHSRSSSPAPDHGSPSVTTHPISPSAPPPPGSPNAVLQQDNSSAPVGAATSSSPSHSVPEAPPAYNPYFKEDSAPGTSD